MGNLVVNKYLLMYIISNQINDLVAVVSVFSDNISDLDDNIYVKQNDILVKMLRNIKKMKKNEISIKSMYLGLSEEEMEIIESLELDVQIAHHEELAEILGIDYLDQEMFMNILDSEIEELSSKYNLRANDDFNKLKEFLSSIRSNLKSSEDKLLTLSNQYQFLLGHGRETLSPEYISLHGNKKYKDELLTALLEKYNKLLRESNKPQTNKSKKR